MDKISERIALARIAKGLNQSDLASAIGVTPQAVQKWETGGSPKRTRLLKVAQVLGTTIEYLMTGHTVAGGAESTDTESQGIEKRDLDFINRIKNLPIECRKSLEILLSEQERLITGVSKAPKQKPDITPDNPRIVIEGFAENTRIVFRDSSTKTPSDEVSDRRNRNDKNTKNKS